MMDNEMRQGFFNQYDGMEIHSCSGVIIGDSGLDFLISGLNCLHYVIITPEKVPHHISLENQHISFSVDVRTLKQDG